MKCDNQHMALSLWNIVNAQRCGHILHHRSAQQPNEDEEADSGDSWTMMLLGFGPKQQPSS